ncbi:MAG: cyclic nucleotide-binding domain-containing protein [bacterium]|nr:cyclic nucleotide-binding domain-containing protein [bacterium]
MLQGLKKLVGQKTDDELQIQRYKKILQERSEPSPEIHLKIGRLYEKIDKKANAGVEYKDAARLYMEREEYVGALVSNKLIVRLDREDADALANVAFIEMQQGIRLSSLEFETFLKDIGQPLRTSKSEKNSTSTKHSSSRLALSRDNRRRNPEKENPHFNANRQQLIDLISGDSDAEEHFDASFDAERYSLVDTIRQELDAENIPNESKTAEVIEDIPLFDLRSHKAPGEPIVHPAELPDEELPFIDLTQNDAPGEQVLGHETSEKGDVPNARDILSRLDSCPLFSKLSEAELNRLQQHADAYEIAEGDSVTQSHDGRQVLFVALEGLIELMVEDDNTAAREPDVFLLKAGDFWGEHAFLGQTGLTLSAVAKTPGIIAEIPKRILAPIAKKSPALLDQLKKTCKRRCFAPFLRHVDLFQELTMEEIQNIAEDFFTKDMKKGSLLIREGEYDESIFLIQSGKVEVRTSFVEREEFQVVKMEQEHTHLAYLEVGDVFGEGAYFTKEPRSATIVALTDGRLLKLPKSRLKKLIHDYPRVGSALQQYHQQRAQATMKIMQSAFGVS